MLVFRGSREALEYIRRVGKPTHDMLRAKNYDIGNGLDERVPPLGEIIKPFQMPPRLRGATHCVTAEMQLEDIHHWNFKNGDKIRRATVYKNRCMFKRRFAFADRSARGAIVS